jgi:hypothetical protein
MTAIAIFFLSIVGAALLMALGEELRDLFIRRAERRKYLFPTAPALPDAVNGTPGGQPRREKLSEP